MNIQKYILVVSAVIFASLEVNAQDMLIVDGGAITTQNTSIITVQGNVVNNTSGTIDNSGTIYVSGDWENNGGNTCLINNSPGTVELNGDAQLVLGANSTAFYNLSLTGVANSLKTLNIDTDVNNKLDLGSDELETQNNIINVNNPYTNSILWNGGFISSLDLGGYVVRATQSDSLYVFPVGSNSLDGIYRAVKLRPNDNASNSYGVRLAAVNPGLDNSGVSASGAMGPFNENNLASDVTAINTIFYHNINRFTGTTPCDVSIDYFNTDGLFSSVAQWDATSFLWEDRNFTYAPSTSGFNLNNPDLAMNKTGVNNFNYDVFAFETFDIKIPGGVTPNNDLDNDFFHIIGIEYYPENELIVFNRWGDIVYQASPYNNEWYGQSNGKMILTGEEVVDGTYFYVLKLNDEIKPLSGSLELKR